MIQDLQWGVENDVDFVAASFIRKASDVRSVVAYLDRLMAKQKPSQTNPRLIRPVVISKIENAEAVKVRLITTIIKARCYYN